MSHYKHLMENIKIEKKSIDIYNKCFKKLDNKVYNTYEQLVKDNLHLKYKPSNENNEDKTIVHWGQRKLFYAELQFLLNYYPKNFDFKKNKFYILYVGAAKGTHLVQLIKMFPEFTYILYDPAYFDGKLKYLANVTIKNQYFTNQDAKLYSDKTKYPNLYFWSDIRYPNLSENELDQQEEFISQDMKLQQDWYLTIKPTQALLKFRLSWNNKITKYLDGTVFLQIWAGRHSTEGRLVPNGKFKEYNNQEYEQALFFYNKILRRMVYGKNIDIKFNHCGHCLDCYKEHLLLKNYCKLKNIDTKNIYKFSKQLTYLLSYNAKY